MDIFNGHSSYKTFSQQRGTLAGLLGESSQVISALKMGQYEQNLKALQAKVHDDTFKIMVVGTFKNGKSTFINSFLGEDILPAYSIPCTAVINEVKYGQEKRAVLHFRNPLPEKLPSEIPERSLAHMKRYNGRNVPPLEIPYDEIEDYVVIPMGEDPREMLLESPYEKVELFWPLELLKNGVEIIDSPGLNEHSTRTKVTMDYLTKADAILMVLNAQALCAATEMEFIANDLKGQGFEDPFFIVNRFDCIPRKEQDMVKRFAAGKLRDYTSFGARGIFYVSALDALEGKLENDYDKYRNSGMAELEKQLSDFLTRNKGRIKLAQPARELKRILNEEALYKVIPMQRKLLRTDLEAVKKSYASIQPRLVNLQHQKEQLSSKLQLRVEQSKSEFRLMASRSLAELMDLVPEWAEEFTPETKMGVNFLKSKARMNAMAMEISDHLQSKVQAHQLQWRNEVLIPLVEAKMSSIFDTAEPDVTSILREVDGIQFELSGETPEEDGGPIWQRVAGMAGGLTESQVGEAVNGGISGLSRDLAVSVAMEVGLCFTLGIFGLLNPVTLVGIVVAIFVKSISTSEKNIVKKMKQVVVESMNNALAEGREENINTIVDGVQTQFAKITDGMVSSLNNEINEVNTQVQNIIQELEKGESNVSRREGEISVCEETIRRLNTQLDDLVFMLVEG